MEWFDLVLTIFTGFVMLMVGFIAGLYVASRDENARNRRLIDRIGGDDRCHAIPFEAKPDRFDHLGNRPGVSGPEPAGRRPMPPPPPPPKRPA